MKSLQSALLIFTSFINLHGLPEGTVGVVGEGNVQVSGNEMVITAPDGSIFEHQSFNVSSEEKVRFDQPSNQARVLNRIMSENAAQIDGTVEANGRLYFSAPNGLIFGSGSIIQAAQLHAIGGGLSNEDFAEGIIRSNDLSAEIENRGQITAEEVILTGRSVKNSGTITSASGSVKLATGNTMEIHSSNGVLGVGITKIHELPSGATGDLASQAILQSGIIEASKVEIKGHNITHSGTISSDEVSFSRFSSLNGSTGTISSNTVKVEGTYMGELSDLPPSLSHDYVNESKEALPVARLDSPNNQISRIDTSLALHELKAHSSAVTELTGRSIAGETRSFPPQVQHLDVRTTDQDLSVGVNFSPVFTNSPSTVLLATKRKINGDITGTLNQYNRGLVYAENTQDSALKLNSMPSNWKALDATTLAVNELKIGLDSYRLALLAGENPTFPDFYLGAEEFFLSLPPNWQEFLAAEMQALNLSLSDVPSSFFLLLEGQVSFQGFFESLQNSMVNQPISEQESLLLQLDLLLNLGLFSDFSYILKAEPQPVPIIEETPVEIEYSLEDQLSEMGGSSSLFGGSFSLTQQSSDNSSSSSTASEKESEGDSQESETSSDTAVVSGPQTAATVRRAQVPRLVSPFAPISQPVLSAEASVFLENALSEKVEGELSKYLD